MIKIREILGIVGIYFISIGSVLLTLTAFVRKKAYKHLYLKYSEVIDYNKESERYILKLHLIFVIINWIIMTVLIRLIYINSEQINYSWPVIYLSIFLIISYITEKTVEMLVKQKYWECYN